MKTIALVSRAGEEAHLAAAGLVSQLEERGMELRLPRELAMELNRPALGHDEDELARGADLVLSVGGDGTLLRAARIATPHDVPMLGINLGGLGFLTEISLNEWDLALDFLMTRRCRRESRLMLDCRVLRGESEEVVHQGIVLNDLVLHRGDGHRLLRLTFSLGGREVGTYRADGIILCTPTGSTAYSLASGGPIVSPQVECCVLTAISPHTLSARPMVLPADAEFEIRETASQPCQLSLDGDMGYRLEPGDRVVAGRCAKTAKFICIEKDFYQKVRDKLKWVV